MIPRRPWFPVLVLLAACGAPSPNPPAPAAVPTASASADAVAVTPMVSGITLPPAEHGVPIEPAPIVAQRGAELFVDGRSVADLDGVKGALGPKLGADRRVALELGGDAPITAALPLFQAVAAAGFTDVRLLVAGKAGPAELPVHAPRVASSNDPTEAERVLHLDLSSPDRYALSWRLGDAVVSTVDVPRGEPLGAKVESEWKLVGQHRDPADRRFDEAIVHATDGTYASLVAVVDAVLGVRRSLHEHDAAALEVALAGALGPAGSEPKKATSSLRAGAPTVTGKLPPEIVSRIVRQSFGRFRLCYENGRKSDPALAGRVAVKMTIDGQGAVKKVTDGGSDLADRGVVECVLRDFRDLAFPAPEDGKPVTVVYPIVFASAP